MHYMRPHQRGSVPVDSLMAPLSSAWHRLRGTHAPPDSLASPRAGAPLPDSDEGPTPAQRPGAAHQSLHGLSLVLILAAAFMVVLDFSIVNVALPSIQREFGFSASAVQWVVTGYAIAFGGVLILGGRAADLFGRRLIFSSGLVVFTAASLAGGLAQDPVLLVTSRVVQGIGAALVAPAALSLITTGFAEGPARTRALGMYGATASIGFVSGLVLGGVLVNFFSWRSVFLVNVPVGVAAILLAPVLLTESRQSEPGRRRLDAGGALLVTTAVAAVVFAVSQANVLGWRYEVAASLLGVSAAAAFALVERRHPDPLIQVSLLRLPRLRAGSGLTFLLGVWNGGEILVLSIYFQQVLHDSPLMTGLAMAPQGVTGFVAGAFGARLSSRIGMRRWLLLTSAAATLGFLILAGLPSGGSYSPVLAAVMLVGFGTAGTAFGAMVTATGGVPNGDQGLVGGVINMSRQIGAAVGAALLPTVAEVANGADVAGAVGDRAAMLVGGLAAVLAVAVAGTTERGTKSVLGVVGVAASAAHRALSCSPARVALNSMGRRLVTRSRENDLRKKPERPAVCPAARRVLRRKDRFCEHDA
jgi:EmrB/QacA subfamily drug resistance transporter